MNDNEVKIGKYQHFKGDVMEVIGKALHSETLEEFVIYRHVTGERAGEPHYWIRPVKMFLGEVERDGKKVPRFKYIG
jgi:cyclomaltodextrinase / maltogenic alpha-amylase / neopullulanase